MPTSKARSFRPCAACKKLQRKSGPSFRSLLFNTPRECRVIYGLINRSPSVIVEGTSSRRQIGGFAPRSVTLRLTMVVPALVFSVLVFDLLVLTTIFASCQLGHRSQCPQGDAAQRSVLFRPSHAR